MAVNVFIFHQLEKNWSECDSDDVVPLCHYSYCYGVGFLILRVRMIIKTYSYRYTVVIVLGVNGSLQSLHSMHFIMVI